MEHTLQTIREVLSYKLFNVAGTPVTTATVLTLVFILALGFWLSRIVQRGIARAFRKRGVTDEGTVGVTSRLAHYVIAVVVFGIALQTIGIKLSALFAAGALFAVAIGFAMQTVVQNFVSGVILLVERSIKPGDILEVQGTILKVVRLGIRSTVARTREDEDIILPNSTLVQAAVKNLTFRDHSFRIRVGVGVTYGSDMKLVREVLEQVARDFDGRHPEPEPVVLLRRFGSSSVDWEVSIWIRDPWAEQAARSALHEAVWFALKEHGIVIAFPQVDVHLDPPVTEAVSALKPAA